MRTIFGFLMASMAMACATTLEVLPVFQPLSLHGTDVGHEFEGEIIQAQVMSRPMVLSGAMPEALVSAIGTPHQLPATLNYAVPECNLLQLYGLKISGVLSEENLLVVTINLNEAMVPDAVQLPIRTVLKLTIDALKSTLKAYHHPANKALKVRLDLVGLSEKNATLRDLSGRFRIQTR